MAEPVSINTNHPYVGSRGVTQETAELFKIGVSGDKCLFQVDDQTGQFVGYVKRVLDDRDKAVRYDFSEVPKSKYLYNYHRAKYAARKAVIVVEGFIDTTKVYQAGYPSVVALMGSIMSDRQEHLLCRWWEHVIFMLDGDKAGRASQKELIARLANKVTGGVHGVALPDGIQPDMLNPAEIKEMMLRAG
jgi:DNA primase